MPSSSHPSPYHLRVSTYYDADADLGFEARAGENGSLERIRADFRAITVKYPFTRALEIGCGPGFDVHWFARRFPEREFEAVDISARMAELASARLERDGIRNARVTRADERELVNRYGEVSFDMVYVYFGALNTVEDLGFAAREIQRLLKPGGHAVLTFVNKWYFREMLVQALKLKFRAALARLRKEWGGYSVSRHLPSHCYSPGQVRKAFRDFSLLETRGYSIFFPAWYNDHKTRRNIAKADRLWAIDQRLQRTALWSAGEYTLFVFKKREG